MTRRLDHDDAATRARAHAAVAQPPLPGTNPLQVRCRHCGGRLAQAWLTESGPVFCSSWPSDDRFPVLVTDGTRRLSRPASRWREGQREPWEVHGCIALLAEPDRPDLMVRCPKHGDAVLDRDEVLRRLRRGDAAWKVPVAGREEYDTPTA